MIQKMFFLEQQVVVFVADGINAVASRQKIAFEKGRKVIDRALGLLNCVSQRAGILYFRLHFWVVRQVLEKANAAFRAVDGHLGPESRRIGFLAAEIGDALLDQRWGPFQTAQ